MKGNKPVVYAKWSYFNEDRVGLLESAIRIWRWTYPKSKHNGYPDSKQVPWGKVEKHFEKSVKSMWNCCEERERILCLDNTYICVFATA